MRGTIQGKNRVREQRQHGSVRGVPGNRHPYRDPCRDSELLKSPRYFARSRKMRWPICCITPAQILSLARRIFVERTLSLPRRDSSRRLSRMT
jgi:hypothetical protein